jgi:hypothetical protein
MRQMDNTATFVALEQMMQNGSLVMAMTDLEKSLKFLEEKGLITIAEYQALLELARKLQVNDQADDKLPGS